MLIQTKKPALLLVILGSLLILWAANRQEAQPVQEKSKFTIQAVSITEKQSRESIN